MRALAWAFIVATVVSAVGVFLPSFSAEQVRGVSLGKHASLSLYQVTTKRELARAVVAANHAGARTPVGAAVLAVMSPRYAGKISSTLVDVGDASRTVDELGADDVGTLGTVLAVVVYGFLALHALVLALIFGDTIEDRFRRKRLIAALVVAVVVAGVAVAIYVISRTAVSEANAEIGVSVLRLGTGAYMTTIAALVALASAVALLIKHVRASRV